MYRGVQNDDIILHLLIAKFTASLTRFQRIEFGFILEMLRGKYNKTDHKQNTEQASKKRPVTSTLVDMGSNIETRPPNSESNLRTWYTVGPYSIMKNLPYPKVNIIKNDT